MLQRADRVAHLNARDDLLSIARDWPVLGTRLAAGGPQGTSGMPRPASRTIGLPVDLHVLRLRAEVVGWARGLVVALVATRTGYRAPHHHDAASLLAHVATHRLGHFTEADDGPAFCLYAEGLAHRVHGAAYPDGFRTLSTGLACHHEGCTGTYTVRPLASGAEPDLVCTRDRDHRVPPAEWARDRWRVQHEDGARHLLAAITGRAS